MSTRWVLVENDYLHDFYLAYTGEPRVEWSWQMDWRSAKVWPSKELAEKAKLQLMDFEDRIPPQVTSHTTQVKDLELLELERIMES